MDSTRRAQRAWRFGAQRAGARRAACLRPPGQLQEVIINLLQNAVEAMDTVRDDRRVLTVRTERVGDKAVIVQVEDTGPGIDAKSLDKVFEAFVTTKPGGMGLGLAIFRMIIDRHGGQLSASPAHPRGAVFRMLLPQGGPPR